MARFIASPCNILKVYINIDVYNMRRTIKVGLIQQSCTGNTAENMDKLKHSIEDVASKGAELVVLQELHNTLYFCQTENTSLFDLAETIPGSIEKCIFRTIRHIMKNSISLRGI